MEKHEIERAIALAGLPIPDSDIDITGADPVFYGPFHLGEGAAVTQALIGSKIDQIWQEQGHTCLLYTSPSPRDGLLSRMPSSA